MPKYPKGHKDVVFYAPKPKRGSRPIAGSTTATNDFLVLVHETYFWCWYTKPTRRPRSPS